MPTYVFECGKCQAEQERVFRLSGVPRLVSCDCGGVARRVIAPVAVHTFRPYTHHLLAREPVHMKTRRQEKEEFAKRGLIDAR